jgi:hypothetical protein
MDNNIFKIHKWAKKCYKINNSIMDPMFHEDRYWCIAEFLNINPKKLHKAVYKYHGKTKGFIYFKSKTQAQNFINNYLTPIYILAELTNTIKHNEFEKIYYKQDIQIDPKPFHANVIKNYIELTNGSIMCNTLFPIAKLLNISINNITRNIKKHGGKIKNQHITFNNPINLQTFINNIINPALQKQN